MNVSNIGKDFIILDYKKGLYQGQHNGYHKEGLGCFCSDDCLFYIGLLEKNTISHFSLKRAMDERQFKWLRCAVFSKEWFFLWIFQEKFVAWDRNFEIW